MIKEILGESVPKRAADAIKNAVEMLKNLREDSYNDSKTRYTERIKEFENSLKKGSITLEQLDFILTDCVK